MAEAIRQKSYGAGDLIWMYNDCWPETGWTIIDYYPVSYTHLNRITRFLHRRFDSDCFFPSRIIDVDPGHIPILQNLSLIHI